MSKGGFTASVKIQLIVTDIPVSADSMAEAVEKAKSLREVDVIRFKRGEFMDGHIEVIGVDVDGSWKLDKDE